MATKKQLEKINTILDKIENLKNSVVEANAVDPLLESARLLGNRIYNGSVKFRPRTRKK